MEQNQPLKRKPIKDMSKEERAAYQREWYQTKVAGKNSTFVIEIHNCSEEFKSAILNAISESK